MGDFPPALRTAIGTRTQAWVGAETARHLRLDTPISQSVVSEWVNGSRTPDPQTVFALEVALGQQPGSLSRLLGYLPADAVAATTVEEAIDADPALDARARRALKNLYATLAEPPSSRAS